jgi:cell shape-determining protein MreC
MSWVRFNHVFAALLVLSALSAFVIPERYTSKAEPQLQGLFYPVAKPARAIGAAISGRVSSRPDPTDTRDGATLREENAELRQELAARLRELEESRLREGERAQLGLLRELCTPVKVVGPDTAASREGLMLQGSTVEGLKQGQVVLVPAGIVGKIDRPPGLAGAQVRLITDRGVRINAYFGRLDRKTNRVEPLRTSPPLIEGIGDGAMRCATSLTMEEVKSNAVNLQAGDWVLLDDRDWDERVHYRPIGKVVRVAPQANSPLYADIRIEPMKNLTLLNEVMVLTK